MSKYEILIIDDDEDVLLALKLLLKENGFSVTTDKNPKNIPDLMRKTIYDVIFLDMNFTKEATDGKEGFYWLRKLTETDPNAVVILITAFGDVELAVKAIKEGATDFILKPWQNEKLLATLLLAIQLRKSVMEVDRLKLQQKQLLSDIDHKSGEMIGQSPAMLKIFALVEKVANTDANVLILGENGTGKELVARAVHRLSQRREKVFISVDMGSITENLFESELYGHIKGSFTDAKENHTGRFESASGGTLFLDEIGNMSVRMQSKLLRAIENREIIPVGSNKAKPIDIRLICATNMPLESMVLKKEFRQDLLYRINTVEIRLPPLRERKDDIPLLVGYFSSIYFQKYKIKPKKIPEKTLNCLEEYTWPGNIRELKHSIERAVIISDSGELKPSDFLFGGKVSFEGMELENFNLDNVEKKIIQKILFKNSGNISQSAEELGLTRAALYRRIEKYDLQKLSD